MKNAMLITFVAIVLSFTPSAKANPLCDICGITEDNIDFWRAIDPSGNGTLSTLDLVLFTKAHQALGSPTIITQAMVTDAINNQIDLNGDGVWDNKDQNIANALNDYMILTGNNYIYFNQMIDCLRAVILNTCP